jgi:hypothetical protein
MTRLAKCFAVIALPIALAGCVQFKSGLILPVGPDTYTTSEILGPMLGGSLTIVEARTKALSSASAHCVKLDKQLLVTNMDRKPEGYELIFRCLSKGDPELQRPNFQSAPDVVIENRNR